MPHPIGAASACRKTLPTVGLSDKLKKIEESRYDFPRFIAAL